MDPGECGLGLELRCDIELLTYVNTELFGEKKTENIITGGDHKESGKTGKGDGLNIYNLTGSRTSILKKIRSKFHGVKKVSKISVSIRLPRDYIGRVDWRSVHVHLQSGKER